MPLALADALRQRFPVLPEDFDEILASLPEPGNALDILYVGVPVPHTTSWHRLKAAEDLGHNVTCLPSRALSPGRRQVQEGRIRDFLFRKGLPVPALDSAGLGEALPAAFADRHFDLLWLDKPLALSPRVLEKLRKQQPDCRIVGYSPDDMGQRHNQSLQFRQLLPYYDMFFTTKSYNPAELEAMGCPNARFVGNAFDLCDHFPWPAGSRPPLALQGRVGFIGTWEEERAGYMHRLAEAGITIEIQGSHWQRCEKPHPLMKIGGGDRTGADYSYSLQSWEISLCFLRKQNRDLQTTRSVEIPACGGFMLAERTGEHEELFEDGREAVFFDDYSSLESAVRFWLDHPEDRRVVAKAGRRRCLVSGYSNHHRMHDMLQQAVSLRP